MVAMDLEAERRARAKARRGAMTLRRGGLQADEHDLSPLSGAEALSLVTRLTREGWSLSGRELPDYARSSIPCRFVPGQLT